MFSGKLIELFKEKLKAGTLFGAQGWEKSKRIEDEWYWVTNGKDVWVAVSCEGAAGGWSNYDTWEDFNLAVVAWKHIPTPSVPNHDN